MLSEIEILDSPSAVPFRDEELLEGNEFLPRYPISMLHGSTVVAQPYLSWDPVQPLLSLVSSRRLLIPARTPTTAGPSILSRQFKAAPSSVLDL